MLKQGTFINKRFNTLLLGCFWGNLAYAINLMTDSIISGNALGELLCFIKRQRKLLFFNEVLHYEIQKNQQP